MNIPINFATWISAFSPIVLLIVLLVIFNMGASKAALYGLILTLITSIFIFKADLKLIINETLKGSWSALIIILIVWTAILMFKVGDKANAFNVIRNKIKKIMPNELLAVLMFGWVFESFLQGITGFGVPVAVGAPLLIGIGVTPIYAVIIPLLGQSFGNTFGTLGAAWDSMIMTGNIQVGSSEYLSTALWTSIFLLVWNFLVGIIISWYYGGVKGVKKGMLAIIIISLIQGLGQLFLSQVNTTLCNFIPALVSFIVVILLSKTKTYSEKWQIENSKIMNRNLEKEEDIDNDKMTLVEAFMPYIVLSLVTLIVLVVPSINELFSKIKIGFSFSETVTGYGYVNKAVDMYSPLTIFTHASFFLFVSAIFGMLFYRSKGVIDRKSFKEIFIETNKMSLPSVLSILGLVIMSNIMSGSGQTVVLANGFAKVLGRGYLVVSPLVGLIGTFMTGSNMSSNILFTQFQQTTAGILGVSKSLVLASQTTGASIGAAISPSKIILGSSTANILGSEGKILRKLLSVVIPFTIIIGIGLFVIS